MTTRIRILPEHVANKIAAGEVVERPASVLKELLENALDAGATQVDVEVSAGGRKLISVSDDGAGMIRDDALLSIERHATSKIRDVDDIEAIRTLGFRGEALAAIASVSRFRMITNTRDSDMGVELSVLAGKIQDVRDIGAPHGTLIEIRDLFFNVPARRKFLRTHDTELAHIRTTFMIQALAAPRVGMSLVADGRAMHRVAAGTPADRIRELFGPDQARHLAPLNMEQGAMRITGFVSRPDYSRADRTEQYVFINGRATSAPLVSYAIREAYRQVLPKDRQPSIFMYIDMPCEALDVNVHPTKREVRFRHPGQVRDVLIDAIREALGTARSAEQEDGNALSRLAPEPMMPRSRPVQMRIENLPQAPTFNYPRLHSTTPDGLAPAFGAISQPQPLFQATPAPPSPSEPRASGETQGAIPPAPAEGAGSSPWAWCRVVGIVGSRFVVLETEDGYVLMDPQAAHERVLYEKFMREIENGKVCSQNLLIPETVELHPKDAARVRKHEGLLKEMGFGLSEFGGDAFVIDALPSHFSEASAATLLRDVSSSLDRAGTRGASGRWREESIAQAACRTAVQGRDRLKLEEIEQLVVDLARTDMPYTCPHGHPTLIFTSFTELRRKFGIG
ncbi:MAG: DNA mismatch repair endonuclease MutL [Verrucomicrobia bacterium]|nr:DNA mismatch repair endonuclease MutL [Verrucomicrobiota bacterium]